jgi:threonyl-tRNA synthetase
MIYKALPRSYRDLPVRLAEFGTVYRCEQSGELNGLTRVRGFTQDDAHLFVTPEQIEDECRETIRLVQQVFKTLRFHDYSVRLSLHDPDDEKFAGDPETWNRAETLLRKVMGDLDFPFEEARGEAAFYGPKIDFIVRDVIGRKWQLGTVQVDYVMPERFGLEYIGKDNQPHRPIMIHRAPFGSMERFTGVLIEHFAGNFPLWLAPVQVAVLPITSEQNEYGRSVIDALRKRGLRAVLDASSEKIGRKIRNAEMQKVPAMLVLGRKEAESREVSVRRHGLGDQGTSALDAVVESLESEARERR